MSDIDGLLTHCYDLLLQKPISKDVEPPNEDEELCVCAKIVEYSEA